MTCSIVMSCKAQARAHAISFHSCKSSSLCTPDRCMAPKLRLQLLGKLLLLYLPPTCLLLIPLREAERQLAETAQRDRMERGGGGRDDRRGGGRDDRRMPEPLPPRRDAGMDRMMSKDEMPQ